MTDDVEKPTDSQYKEEHPSYYKYGLNSRVPPLAASNPGDCW